MSLDTINDAFETLLDSFFQDTAWDISSDISALQTMMARDGLTGRRDFVPGERIRTVGKDVNAQAAGTAGTSEVSGQGAPAAAASAPGDYNSYATGDEAYSKGAAAYGGGGAAAMPAPKEK